MSVYSFLDFYPKSDYNAHDLISDYVPHGMHALSFYI